MIFDAMTSSFSFYESLLVYPNTNDYDSSWASYSYKACHASAFMSCGDTWRHKVYSLSLPINTVVLPR